jgi:hypothetical protein
VQVGRAVKKGVQLEGGHARAPHQRAPVADDDVVESVFVKPAAGYRILSGFDTATPAIVTAPAFILPAMGRHPLVHEGARRLPAAA